MTIPSTPRVRSLLYLFAYVLEYPSSTCVQALTRIPYLSPESIETVKEGQATALPVISAPKENFHSVKGTVL
jgi:hypothetical protein